MLTVPSLDQDFSRILAGEPGAVRDPYPVYDRLRETGDIHLFRGAVPIAASHAAVRQLSMDDGRFLTHRGIDRFSLDDLAEADRQKVAEICAFEQLQMSGMNGEAHRRVRAAAQKGFGSPRAADMGDYAGKLVADIADKMVASGGDVDLIEMAYRVPLLVVMRMLGAPEADIDLLRGWSDDIAGVKQFVGANIPLAKVRAAHDGIQQLKAYIGDMARDLRRRPDRTHLMGLLLDAEEGSQLSADELSSTFVVIFYAGHETTTNLIGNGLLALMRNRDQWARLRENPSLSGSTVEEVLRYDPPVQMIVRRTAEDVEVFDTPIAAGTNVMLLYGAANRDPLVFDRPDSFDIARPQNKHLGFGYGVHVCLGASLARLEGRIVFEHFAKRFPDMVLAADPADLEWHSHAVFHGIKHLPVTLGADRGVG
ncbi:MAG: cytochrome P450 [Sphingomonadaceae bacterium]|nr:cytochrome P450 [Sphingomonadaceae bacterium]